jgi:hypothetical protein
MIRYGASRAAADGITPVLAADVVRQDLHGHAALW